MSKTMIVSVFGAAVVLAAVLAATAFVATNAHEMSPSIPAAVDSSDYFLRHPEGVMARAAVDTSDYFLWHPEGVTTFAAAAPEKARFDAEAVADAGGEKGHSFEVTFTKWISSPPNMIGVVGGDVGPGTFAGEIKSMTDDASKSFTTIVAVYHISGSQHSFSADIEAVQNNTAGTGVITGEIAEGWLKGRALSGEYRVLPECNMVTEPNAYGKLCFQGTLNIPAAP